VAPTTAPADTQPLLPCEAPGLLLDLLPELQLHIAGFLTDPTDCGALCIATPRLGLAAMRELPQYKEILVSVALRMYTGQLVVDEALLRRYLWDKRMTPEGCRWLTEVSRWLTAAVRLEEELKTRSSGRPRLELVDLSSFSRAPGRGALGIKRSVR